MHVTLAHHARKLDSVVPGSAFPVPQGLIVPDFAHEVFNFAEFHNL
jgi:hypothetical protein